MKTWSDAAIPLDQLPTSKKQAAEAGIKRFFDSTPCKDGHLAARMTSNSNCTECLRRSSAERYRKDPKYFSEANRKWHEANRERHAEKSRRFNGNLDPIELAARRKRYKDSLLERNPDGVRAQRAVDSLIRRSRKAGGFGIVTARQWEEIKSRYGHRCLSCKAKGLPLVRDHVIPLVKGGLNTPENIQPLCQPCNLRKFTKIIDYRTQEVAVENMG